jgi:hypothetical protein
MPFIVFTLFMVGFGCAQLAAQQAPGYPPPASGPAITVGVTIFADYSYRPEPRITDADGNRVRAGIFNVSRGYVDLNAAINSFLQFRLTPDVARDTGEGVSTNGSLRVRLKYAYAVFRLERWTGSWPGTFVRLGLQQTPYIETHSSVYRYRFQGTPFAQRDGGLSSADSGVSARIGFPGGYGDVQAGVFNGEGYQRVEVNDQKSFEIRGTVRPLPGSATLKGLRLTGYYRDDHYQRNAPRRKIFGNVLFEHAHLNAGLDIYDGLDQVSTNARALDSKGWSVFATPFFRKKGDGLEALLRYDWFQPDAVAGSVRRRAILGLAWWFAQPNGDAVTAVMLDYERVTSEHFPIAVPRQQQIALHVMVDF